MSNYGKFHVAYLFGSGKAWIKAGGGVRAKEGFLEGPLYSPMGVTYVGSIMNEEMRFEVNISVNKLSSTTSVRIMYNVDEKSNFWQRIAGFSFYDLIDHVVKGHLVAVLSNYPIMKRTC
ncbi:hypothetical protein [Metallosphaera hakonensis]|uniref:Uncharacterized protein n=2 Tax=Metallosphaera hakonensis TaxID=79601 RepID=A0A2U9IWK4_9CREN|nr:hypothetical protein [Metallosphaera hakonensis]AWS00386.1 hypothetical protein DFR87_12670 [Metallosphaera hakonensis JCM 8857 = DSM 7519]